MQREAAMWSDMPAFLLLLIAVLVAVAFYLDSEPLDHKDQSEHKLPSKQTVHQRR